MRWFLAKVKVTTYNEVPEGGIKKVQAEDKDVAVYKVEGQIYATANVCTHEGCFIDENNEVRGDVVECTCHGSQFNIKNGEVLLPPAIEPIQSYKTEVIGEDVYVEV